MITHVAGWQVAAYTQDLPFATALATRLLNARFAPSSMGKLDAIQAGEGFALDGIDMEGPVQSPQHM